MASQRTLYTLSGEMGNGLFMAPLFGIFAALFGAFVYAYIDVYSPVVGVITFLVVLGLGFGVGAITGIGGEKGHCRNAWFLHLVGFFVGVLTWYVSWACFEWVLMRRSGEELGFGVLVGLVLQPGAVWGIAQEIAKEGWYSVGSAEVRGIGSWVTWALEALAIVGLSTLSAGSALSDNVYSEASHTWVPKWSEGPLQLRLPSQSETLAELHAGDLDQLAALDPAGADELPRLLVEVWASEASPDTAAFKLKLQVAKVEKNEVSVETKDFSPQYVASQEDVARLRALTARQPVPLDDAGSVEASAS